MHVCEKMYVRNLWLLKAAILKKGKFCQFSFKIAKAISYLPKTYEESIGKGILKHS